MFIIPWTAKGLVRLWPPDMRTIIIRQSFHTRASIQTQQVLFRSRFEICSKETFKITCKIEANFGRLHWISNYGHFDCRMLSNSNLNKLFLLVSPSLQYTSHKITRVTHFFEPINFSLYTCRIPIFVQL